MSNPTNNKTETKRRPPRLAVWIYRMLPTLIILGGIAIAAALILAAPEPERKPPPPLQSLVTISHPVLQDQPVIVRAMGTVLPSREVSIRPRVSGEVISTHPDFKEGTRFSKGDTLITIDPADYEIAITRADAQVARANYDYQLELGYQDVAKREWSLIREGRAASEREALLALRKPQLQNVQAGLASAQAELKQAQLNLARTEIKVPFNSQILTRQAEVGAVASTQEPVATLVGSDEYWVQVSIPIDRLRALPGFEDPEKHNIEATVFFSRDASRQWVGRVIRLLPALEQSGRMARLLVAIADPLDQNPDTPLLLSSYVYVELKGRPLPHTALLPRVALREGSTLWLATPENELEIRPVTVAWRDAEFVYISDGIAATDRVILSAVAIPVSGMPLVIQNDTHALPATTGADQ